MTHTMNPLPILCCAALLAGAGHSQQLQAGLQATTQSLPAGSGNVLHTPNGVVVFDGLALRLLPPNQPPQTLLQFATSRFGSFTLAAGPQHVLFGESSNNEVWLVPLQGQAPAAPLATVVFNYDAVLLDPQRALLSAKTSGFATLDNDLVLLNLVTGQTRILATLPGASGALALADNGDLYYGTASLAFPPAPGSVAVLRVRRPVLDAAIANQIVLGLAATETVITGLDAIGDLAFDDDGDLWFTDWFNSRVRELNDVAGPAPTVAPIAVDYATAAVSASSLQFLPGPGPFVLEPFQPLGGTLLIQETDFGSTSQLRHLRSAPASLTVSVAGPIPAGAFDLVTAAGPANGVGVLAFATAVGNGSVPVALPGFEQPLHWSPALLAGAVLVPIGFDAAGHASLTILNPGFAPALAATAQVAFVSALGSLGATAPLALSIGQ
jgi:hypothetical protein